MKKFMFMLLLPHSLVGMDNKENPNANHRDQRIHISFREAIDDHSMYTDHKNNLNQPSPTALRHHSISINSSEPEHPEQEVIISRNNLKIAAFAFVSSLITAGVTVAITLSTQKNCN